MMEQNNVSLTTALNHDCLREIVHYLKLDDAISFADCCKCMKLVANDKFRKYKHYNLDRTQFLKGVIHTNNLISHIGPHLSALTICLYEFNLNLSRFLKIIDRKCTQLKRLQIEYSEREAADQVPLTYNFETVQTLTLIHFNSTSTRGLLQSFRHLEQLCFQQCFISEEESMALIHNNPRIESFLCVDLRCFNILPPNVQELSIENRNLDLLPNVCTLNFLTSLHLDCLGKNITSPLRELAKRGIMKEMDLENINIDDEFFDFVAQFGKMQLLQIDHYRVTEQGAYEGSSGFKRLKPKIVWPTELSILQLKGFEFTLDDVTDIVRQLISLQALDLYQSQFAKSDSSYYPDIRMFFNKITSRIIDVVESSDGKQCREICLPGFVDIEDSGKMYLLDMKRIKICTY
ncbi:uncharacterized protein LOC119072738 [Bradysia coprophila]|uniref:uncharacterized protein LOC119072738 n=1 Tax=Bradysia coprophila TaxID=38358 RepID=UPI00187D7125|nr:uncharacterized protein LOC119072738 [Bradysia coprophila]